MNRLSRLDILRALEALSARLPVTESPIRIALMGGAALVLLYGARETTKDVDAIILDSVPGSVREAARSVGADLGLPVDWLNEGAKGYLQGLALGECLMRTGSVEVYALAPEQLLAMKLCAWRDDLDIADARLLLSKFCRSSKDTVWQSVQPFLVPGRELKAAYAFEDLWEALHGTE